MALSASAPKFLEAYLMSYFVLSIIKVALATPLFATMSKVTGAVIPFIVKSASTAYVFAAPFLAPIFLNTNVEVGNFSTPKKSSAFK